MTRGNLPHMIAWRPSGKIAIASVNLRYAVLDLKMPGESGLSLVPELKVLNARIKMVVLTDYASIATAVEAIKLGAVYYLAKPADADDIVTALHRVEGDAAAPPAVQPLSVERLEWEHIQRVLMDCGGNVSAAVRSLGMPGAPCSASCVNGRYAGRLYIAP